MEIKDESYMTGFLYLEDGTNEQGEPVGRILDLTGSSYEEIADNGLKLLKQEGAREALLDVDGWQMPVDLQSTVESVMAQIEAEQKLISPFSQRTVGELANIKKGKTTETPSQFGE